MTDTDRLAALLHADPDVCGNPSGIMVHSGEGYCDRIAARLAAAGVTLAPQPAPDARRLTDLVMRACDCADVYGHEEQIEAALRAALRDGRDDLGAPDEHRLHDYAAGVTVAPQPAPDALPVDMDDYMAGYRQAKADLKPYGTSDRDSLREKIDRELCRDGQLDWDECSRLADLLSVAIWNELSMFPIAQPAPDALRAAAQEHGLCSCDGGPRPLGNGREYHYVGCDYDPALRAALGDEP